MTADDAEPAPAGPADVRGLFYLGRTHSLAAPSADELAVPAFAPAPVLYDSADLTTHAVCVGMTGSGKTGLGLALLEEAALDGIPAIAIDPKGDLGNLLLAFPNLQPADFRPWIDEGAAVREGLSLDELAERTAAAWRQGLAEWGQDGARVARFKSAVDCAIYTPGSSAGLPVSILKSFAAPPAALLDDADAFADRVQAAASGLLALLGIDADPINSREHILLSKVLDTAWREGRDLELGAIIHDVQRPPFRAVGAMPTDSFLAPKDRDELAFKLNNLLASPSFAAWLEGEPLDVERLLYNTDARGVKRPRLSIMSIAHLDEQQRMFFVTLLLGELITWMRTQSGASSLRAVLYMDEVFGYFPPTANPPSKKPMLTLLKQARAYGVGCVLATQNPVDLDYKGLSNAGTWLLGRLQTERDKARVLDGLEGASTASGRQFDRGQMDRLLSALGKRVFVMNNVHDPAPTLFQSRWALSYLAGPLTRTQVATLMAERKAALKKSAAAGAAASAGAAAESPAAPAVSTLPPSGAGRPPLPGAARPLVSGDVPQRFWPLAAGGNETPRPPSVTYRPALLGRGRLHYVQAAAALDLWKEVAVLQPLGDELPAAPWAAARVLAATPALEEEPHAGAAFAPLPGELGQKKTYAGLKRELEEWLYQTQRYTRLECPELGMAAEPEEPEAAFRARVAPLVQAARRQRALEARAAERAALEQAIAAAAHQRAEHRWWFFRLLATAASRAAEIVVTGLMGRRSRKQLVTSTVWNQAMKSRSLAAAAAKSEREATRALEKLKALEGAELARLEAPLAPAAAPLTTLEVSPRKSDIDVDEVLLVWLPAPGADAAHPAVALPT